MDALAQRPGLSMWPDARFPGANGRIGSVASIASGLAPSNDLEAAYIGNFAPCSCIRLDPRDLWLNSSIRIMRNLLIAITLLVPLLAAQAEERPAQLESFTAFWAHFKSAVTRQDKEAVAAVTMFPFMGQQARAAFLKSYPSTFTKEVRKCIATVKPVKAEERDGYLVFCGEEIYTFEKVNGGYKFTSIDMND